MKVRVDQVKCNSLGVCVMDVPEVFRFEPGSKKAKVIVDLIPPQLHLKCLEAQRKCTADAIIIEDDVKAG